jgi:hypothetical protein
VAIAIVFYVLFRPVNRTLSLMAAFFRLAQAAILGFNLLNLFLALQLLGGSPYLAAVESGQRQALALLFLNMHSVGYTIGLIFFGVSLAMIGYLVWQSGYAPKILSILLFVAAAGYLIDSFAVSLLPNYETYAAVFEIAVATPAFIAELIFALWLLIKGVRVPEQQTQSIRQGNRLEGIAQ